MCSIFTVKTFIRIVRMHTPTAMTPGGRLTVPRHAVSARVRLNYVIEYGLNFIASPIALNKSYL